MIFALDTSGAYCVLALAEEDGAVRAACVFEGRRTLSRRLMGEMDGLLTRSGLTLADVRAYAVGLGPGSFTGVRVGVTTAKMLALVTEKPLVGVGTLDAYAAAWQGVGRETSVVPVLPSRKGEVYAAVYRGGELREGPFAESVEAIEKRLQSLDRAILCGDVGLIGGWTGPALAQPWTPPEGLARLAARRLGAGDTDDPLGLVPLYVVAPSISTPKALAIRPLTGVGTGTAQ